MKKVLTSHVFWLGLMMTLAVGAKLNAKNQAQAQEVKVAPEHEYMLSFAI